jgi:uncharacterized protein (DUF1684 family)
MKNHLLLLVCFLFTFVSCSQKEQISKEAHLAEVNNWHEKQMTSLRSENGWLNLIGLYWLVEGIQTLGSGENMDLRIEKTDFPDEIGRFELQEGKVFFLPSVEGISSSSGEVTGKVLIFDAENQISEAITFGSLNWVIIKRSDAIGVRLRDYEAEAVSKFEGVEQFPIDISWRLIAEFVPYQPVKQIPITNVIGQTSLNNSPGYLQFEWEGEFYRIDALGDENDEEFFLIFADETSGDQTYGGGRYMYVKHAGSDGKTILDFNKAYNPPCVYTPHATCPLPPRQNILDLAITAGHKDYGDH